MSDYFYEDEADRFKFYRTPKELFTEHFKELSIAAKLLYGILLDRNSMSIKNKWTDDKGRIYIFFSREEVQEILCVGKNKPTELFKELVAFDLIEEVRQGLNRANIIYVKKFYTTYERTPENRESKIPKKVTPKSRKKGANNTYPNDTYQRGVPQYKNFPQREYEEDHYDKFYK